MTRDRDAVAKLFRQEYDLAVGHVSAPPIVNLCNLMLTDAFKSGARGIRAVPVDAEHGGIDYDIDGQWQPVMQLPIKVFSTLINRFKVMAVLDTGRVPVQEGELHVRLDGVLRVLTIRTEATSAAHELLTIALPADGAA
ncbi:MAG: hypothetical protein R2910_02200 [Gemmatimonadales bacterium]